MTGGDAATRQSADAVVGQRTAADDPDPGTLP